MSVATSDERRHLVPRWRSFRDTIALGELSFPRKATNAALTRGLDQLENDWYDNRSLEYAADFAGAAIVAGVPHRAEATVPLLQRSGDLHRMIATAIIGSDTTSRIHRSLDDPRRARSALKRDPRNVIRWLDLARIQFGNGHRSAARKSMTVALQLGPNSRFALRAAGAFFVSIGEPDRAAEILEDVARETNDPWLISAEIAAASLAERPSKLIRRSRSQLDTGIWDRRSSSELASEIATLENSSGRSRRAKQLFRMSLQDPTENSIAQAVYVSAEGPDLALGDRIAASLRVETRALEAQAMQSEANGQFRDASSFATEWLSDQRFSRRAATYASYIAAAGLRDWSAAIESADNGLRVHSTYVPLLNNKAYALIEGGQNLDEARRLIDSAENSESTPVTAAVLSATKGLFEYRSGNVVAGQSLYESAASSAKKLKAFWVEATALAMHAKEIDDPEEARRMLERARQVPTDPDPVLTALFDRVQATLDARR